MSTYRTFLTKALVNMRKVERVKLFNRIGEYVDVVMVAGIESKHYSRIAFSHSLMSITCKVTSEDAS